MDGNALTGNPSTRNPSSIGPEIGAAETPSQSPTIQASRTRVSPFTGGTLSRFKCTRGSQVSDHTLGEPADWLIYVLLAESEPRPERRTSETGQNLEQAQYPSGPIGMQLATAPLENNEGYNMGQIAHGFQHHDQYLMGPAVTQFNQTNYDMAQVVLDCQSYDQYSTEFPAYNTGQILLYSQE